ncbi:glycosyl hydrolase 115 family protein [Paenibacillus crassostreae]|uniref:Glycosyl hydrolase n=1 Tax=Paenibacillus crassostreae TaxID=1763538 RepID=A0A167B986_9BACL|nr:glycosyl hydrolase 115 family protein [Paenibacillus crassostreae]AOZ93060.1 glycosyl hydrolase [Paenibacillus crassostreae]OAB71851.1 glycosyl hydrolase [Paenibacillus crassostreae]
MFHPKYIRSSMEKNDFQMVHQGKAAHLYVASTEEPGITRAAHDLCKDITRITQQSTRLINQLSDSEETAHVIIIGTIGHSPVIDQLIADGKVDTCGVANQWESFVIQTVMNPQPGIESALVIAGSDKRGTIFGIYDISENIGVSPWHWWADVPPNQQNNLYVIPGIYKQGTPSVKYRGIFLNDEGPSLMAWGRSNYQELNHDFYASIFELLLRLKANYLWPAMWDNTFHEDDPLNPEIADYYGIVIGTSHHEPMLRPHGDWKKHRQGPWDYSINDEVLYRFWEEGIARSRDFETIVTLGMRGDGDEAMGGHLSFEEKIQLLQHVVEDQREIIANQMDKDITQVPQLWALYKEVQDYYEHGMRVPDDITLLWSDDNHGNLRRVPTEEERTRSGGAGIYYHLDYVGGPRSYKWLNTVPIQKIWEQMHKAYEYGADRIWILNVGDLKPMEFPLEYFLRMAWNIEHFTKDNFHPYTLQWVIAQFGVEYADEITDLIERYTKYNGRLKPELLNAVELYSSIHYKEAEIVVSEFRDITTKAEALFEQLPGHLQDAFFQLVLFPVKASAQVLELQMRAERSKLYAKQGRIIANVEARAVELLFEADRELTFDYNKRLSLGKWDHMMDQTHIGYTYWNHPPHHIMPEVGRVEEREGSEMGIAVEGSVHVWPANDHDDLCKLPEFDVFTQEKRYFDIFNKCSSPFKYSVKVNMPWIKVSSEEGQVYNQRRIWVDIDWETAPKGEAIAATITVIGAYQVKVNIEVSISNPVTPSRESLSGHIESNGYISIEAEHYSRKLSANGADWERIAGYGRTLSSMAVFPVTTSCTNSPEPATSPRVEYQVYVVQPGELTVELLLAPSNDFVPGMGLRIGVSFDNGPVQICDAIQRMPDGSFHEKDWEKSVILNIRTALSTHHIAETGYHTLTVWMVDPIVVLQKIVIHHGVLESSYLGPPESYYGGKQADSKVQESEPSFDPVSIPGIISLPAEEAECIDIFVEESGIYEVLLAGDGDSDGNGNSKYDDDADTADQVNSNSAVSILLKCDGHDVSVPIGYGLDGNNSRTLSTERIVLEAGEHVLEVLSGEGCVAPKELVLRLISPDVLSVRPSLRRGSLLPHKPLIAQIGIINKDSYFSHQYAITVSLYAEDGSLIDQTSLINTIAVSGEEMHQLCLSAIDHSNVYKLKVAITMDGQTRGYESDWTL